MPTARDRSARGFTLIELMIVVAVVAILAAVAYPAYTDAILKGRRAEGRTAIADLVQQQERYMTQYNSYLSFSNGSTSATNAGGTAVTAPFKVYSGTTSGASAYTLGSRVCGTGLSLQQCVEVFAFPVKADPIAGTLWMRSTGEKGCDGTDATKCWK